MVTIHFKCLGYLASLGLAVILNGCTTTVTGDRRPEGPVVERNKEVKPIWLDLALDELVTTQTGGQLHHALFKQRDLPIGIKTAQTSAVEISFNAWKVAFDEKFSQLPNVGSLKNSGTDKDLEAAKDQLSRRLHAEVTQIEDIYYERIRIDDRTKVPELGNIPDYFDIHALVNIQPLQLSVLILAAKSQFINAKNPAWRKWAQNLAQNLK
jgi:hypothetical protein